MGLPGNAGDNEANHAVDGNEDPQLPGVSAAPALNYQQCAKEAEDGAGRTFHSSGRQNRCQK
ncbi:hypothetical protein AHiyo8_34780 [Arthrobacter sp. Hiyo8]|nr:hypothetical protein AHiyo8_34780 [Arthrobacter sp. Hiyo8]